MRRRTRALLVGILATFVCALGFGTAKATNAFFATTVPVRNVGAFVSMSASGYDSIGAPTVNSVGGLVRMYVASNALNIGDVVYVDTLNKVDKGTTAALYNEVAGIVVGGRSTSLQGSIAAADVGTAAAAANRPVWVLRTGRAWCKNDAAGNLTAGGLIAPSTTVAGSVTLKPAPIDSLYRVIGRTINGGAASATVICEINIK